MLWKIYFWILATIASINVLSLFIQILEGQVSGILLILTTVVYVLAVYSYTFNKNIFSKRTWKRWLVIVVAFNAIRWSALGNLDNSLDIFAITVIIMAIIFPLPAWYCIYRLGFDKKERAKNAKVFNKKTA